MAGNSFGSRQDKNTTTSTQTPIIKSLAVQGLKNKKLEEQYINVFEESFHVIEGQVQLNGIIVIRPKSRPRFMQRNKNFMLLSG